MISEKQLERIICYVFGFLIIFCLIKLVVGL